MATGDPVKHCDICGNPYYLNTGHSCSWVEESASFVKETLDSWPKWKRDWAEDYFKRKAIEAKLSSEMYREH